MSDLSIQGIIKEILPIETGTSKAGKEWQKLDFVIETTDQFPKRVCFTLFGDKTSLIDGHKLGDTVDVKFNLESREFNGKWYHNINAWTIIGKTAGNSVEDEEYIPEYKPKINNNEEEEDGLPF